MGPLISPQAKERVEHLIQRGVEEGAKVLLDGRNVKVTGYENGNFVGPTILSNVTVRFLFSFGQSGVRKCMANLLLYHLEMMY